MSPAVIDCAAAEIARMGFSRLLPDCFDQEALHDQHLIHHVMREHLRLDPKPGNRRRAYSLARLSGERLTRLPARPYSQSIEYNPDAGGEQRSYVAVPDIALGSRTLAHLARVTADLAATAMPDDFPLPPSTAGIHFVSYEPDSASAAWSLPVWLHKDQERFVALFLVEMSGNLLGGETVISGAVDRVDHMFRLNEPFEAVFLTRATGHAVIPMASANGRKAHRRIILITFE